MGNCVGLCFGVGATIIRVAGTSRPRVVGMSISAGGQGLTPDRLVGTSMRGEGTAQEVGIRARVHCVFLRLAARMRTGRRYTTLIMALD